jgi:Fic family protein
VSGLLKDMERGSTGRYEVTRVADEEVRAFLPHPLPPDPPVDLTGDRIALLEKANLALGRLDGIASSLPEPGIFLYSYVRREAVLTSQIEGTQSTLSDLLLFELEEAPGVPLDDVAQVSNYVAACEHGMSRLRGGFPLSNRLIREMHATLMAETRGHEKTPGEFRRSQNWIGGSRPGIARFVPPPAHRVEEAMAALERFIHTDMPYSPLIRAGLAHVQFETIHPFLDGNGRIGRLLIAFILHQGGVLSHPLLYLSLYFKAHRDDYYRLLDLVRTAGNWEAWLDFFLSGVAETAQNAVETVRRLETLFKQDKERIGGLGRGAERSLRMFQILCQRPLVTIGEASRRTGLTFPTATKALTDLVELGIVHELTGGQRNRVFSYARYLAILSEGIAP